jgi:hypothetical protein
MHVQAEEKRRVAQSPITDAAQGSSPVFNVELGDNEEVEWVWTHYANGQSVVTGYQIINKDSEQ